MQYTHPKKLASALLIYATAILSAPFLCANFVSILNAAEGFSSPKGHRSIQSVSPVSERPSPNSILGSPGVEPISIQKNCGSGQWLCHNGLTCVSENVTCNELPDCDDGSDELVSVCGCLPEEFECRDQCIPDFKRCNTKQDCVHGEDEEECDTWHCPASHFKCHNGFCIPSEAVCDFVNDCGDESDEDHCDHRDCYFKEFRCRNGECIRPGLLCDGVQDCVDGSDENECNEDAFAVCGSGKVVHRFFWCDGAPDCADNHADETKCGECKGHEFKCSDDQCIPRGNICDAQCDCADCADEKGCDKFYERKSGTAKCILGNSMPCIVNPSNRAMDRCIAEDFICDQFNHCHNGAQISDERGCTEKDTCEEEAEGKKSFRCRGDGRCLPKEIVCDFKIDCLFGDDEQNCEYRACGSNEWRCDSGECVPEDALCNLSFECYDKSDEMNCENHKCKTNKWQCKTGQCLAPELRCDFHNDCPDNSDETNCGKPRPCSNHEFACADGRQCIPLENRCTMNKDRNISCADGSHLLNCRDFLCPPDMFKCRSGPCLVKSNQCDGYINCPDTWDDEDFCAFQCSESTPECRCHNLEVDCSGLLLDQLPDDIEPQINRFLFLGNNLSASLHKDYFKGRSNLVYLDLSENGIVSLPSGVFESLWRLRILILRNNRISELVEGAFLRLHNLRTLDLQGNQIATIGPLAFYGLSSLSTLDLSNQRLKILSQKTFVGLRNLTTLNLSNNLMRDMEDATFSGLQQLQELNVLNNELESVSAKTFATMPKLRRLLTDERRWCCLATHVEECRPPADEFSSCEDLMSSSVLRVCIWVLGVVAFVGNTFVIVWRSLYVSGNKLHSFLIVNLALGDLMMGAYLLVIAAVDVYYRGVYATAEQAWRKSFLCKSAGFCSTFSSELSVFTLTVITVDRLIVIKFPFGHRRFDGTGTRVVMAVVWLLVMFLSALPLAPIDYFSDFYGRSGVCLALHITNEKPNGWEYAVFIFIVLNFVSFAIIAVSYILMYTAAKTTQTAARERDETENSRGESSTSMAKRMTLIVITDAACWLPIIALGIVSLMGATIPPKVYAWVAVFILPLNAAVNPILYTLSTAPVRKRLWGPLVSKARSHPHGDPFRASVSCGTWKSSMRTRFTIIETEGETRCAPVNPLSSFPSDSQLKQNLIQESLEEDWKHTKDYPPDVCTSPAPPNPKSDRLQSKEDPIINNIKSSERPEEAELIPLTQLTNQGAKLRSNIWKCPKRHNTDQRYD